MEYIEGDTLKDYLERKGKLNDEEIKAIFTQMVTAVGYLQVQFTNLSSPAFSIQTSVLNGFCKVLGFYFITAF